MFLCFMTCFLVNTNLPIIKTNKTINSLLFLPHNLCQKIGCDVKWYAQWKYKMFLSVTGSWLTSLAKIFSIKLNFSTGKFLSFFYWWIFKYYVYMYFFKALDICHNLSARNVFHLNLETFKLIVFSEERKIIL